MHGDIFDCNYDDDFDSIDSSDSCESVNLGNQTWIHKKDDDSDETVKSDNQLGLDKKHDDEIKLNKDDSNTGTISKDMEEPVEEVDNTYKEELEYLLEFYDTMIPSEEEFPGF